MSNKYDIIIGIPSYNEGDNIANVAVNVDKGLKKYFPEKKALIVNCDGGSQDNTEEEFKNSKTETEKKFIQAAKGTTGKGTVFNMLFKLCGELKPDAVMVVDGDIMSPNLTEWVKYLLEPVFEGHDYVTPMYSRHKYDGTITNNIVYPLVYGLLGKNIRQPIGGDFAFSGRLADHWMKRDWVKTTFQYGIDIFMTTNAIFGGFKICQSGLGAKIHKPSAPKLGPMFVQVVSTLFTSIISNKDKWMNKDDFEEMKIYGLSELAAPQDLVVNKELILKNTLDNYKEESLKKYLDKDVFNKVKTMFSSKDINITSELWVEIVFSLIETTSKLGKGEVEDLAETMKALYFGRTYSFINETYDMNSEEAEKKILAQAKLFRAKRTELINKLNDKKEANA